MHKQIYKNCDRGEMCDSINVQWKNLNVVVETSEYSFRRLKTIKEETHILKNASGTMNSGELIAVLGPSGSGKTTLIAAISQRLRGKMTGQVRINGLLTRRSDMTKLSCFVPQFDITINVLTPREHLYFMGELKMDRTWSSRQKDDRINLLLWRLGLEHVADTRIDKLSGGERKKLNLATDLLTDPQIMFCDEPTTGLDSFSALNVIRSMKSLAEGFPSHNNQEATKTDEYEMLIKNDKIHKAGKAIMCSIHHPTSELFEIFTHVIIMHAGRIAFQGTLTEAQQFFFNLGFQCPLSYNPAEYYIQVVTKEAESNISFKEAIGSSIIRSSIQMPTGYSFKNENMKRISWLNQVCTLITRSMVESRRNMQEYFIALFLFLTLGLSIAVLYADTNGHDQSSVQGVQGAFYIITAQIIFTTSHSVAHVYPSLLPILRRETGENVYSLSAFYIAKIICRVPISIIDAFAFLSIVYMFAGFLNDIWLYIQLALILTATGITSNAYGCMISGLFESSRMTSEIAPPFDILFTVLGGLYLKLNTFPHLKLISIFFHSNEAMALTYWHDIVAMDCASKNNGSCFRNGTEVLQSYSYKVNYVDIWMDYLGLLILCALFHLIGFFGVRRMTRKVGFY